MVFTSKENLEKASMLPANLALLPPFALFSVLLKQSVASSLAPFLSSPTLLTSFLM